MKDASHGLIKPDEISFYFYELILVFALCCTLFRDGDFLLKVVLDHAVEIENKKKKSKRKVINIVGHKFAFLFQLNQTE